MASPVFVTVDLDALRAAYAVKATSASRTIRDFRDEAKDIIDAFLAGDRSKTVAQNAFMRLIDGKWIDISEQAWADGGRDLEDLSNARLTEQLSAMRDHAREMFNTLAERRDKALEAGESTAGLGDNNAELWANNLTGQYNDWKIASAEGTKQLFQWVLGATEDHCDTCSMLANGQAHTADWFMRRGYIPGQGGANLECGGWRCDCQLIDVGGHDFTLTPDMEED